MDPKKARPSHGQRMARLREEKREQQEWELEPTTTIRSTRLTSRRESPSEPTTPTSVLETSLPKEELKSLIRSMPSSSTIHWRKLHLESTRERTVERREEAEEERCRWERVRGMRRTEQRVRAEMRKIGRGDESVSEGKGKKREEEEKVRDDRRVENSLEQEASASGQRPSYPTNRAP